MINHNANRKVITLSNNHRRRCMIKIQTDRFMESIKKNQQTNGKCGVCVWRGLSAMMCMKSAN